MVLASQKAMDALKGIGLNLYERKLWVALDRAKKKIEEDTKLTIQRVDELKSSPILKELGEIHTRGLTVVAPEEITGALKGRYSVIQQLSSMFKVASKKINIITTPEGLNELFENHLNELKKAVERGVKVQIATTGADKATEIVKGLNGIAEVRNLNQKDVPIAGRFVVVDGKELVFSLTDHKVHNTQDMAFWSRSEHAAGSLLDPLFKMVWNSSKPVS